MKVYNHVGKRIGPWNVISMFHENGKKKYVCRCEDGHEKVVNSYHITRIIPCVKCKLKQEKNKHLGERHHRLKCVGFISDAKGHTKYLIKCDCGKEIEMKLNQFKKTSSCKSCSKGFYSGKRVGKSILIERHSHRLWKKHCDCGKFFIGVARKPNCGCIAKNKITNRALLKLGKKYEYLTVKSIFKNHNGHTQFLMHCKCGKEFVRNNGHEFKSKSCGCKLNVPVGEKANKATLKNCEVISIRELYNSGTYTMKQLSDMFKKSENYIYRIIHRKIWKYI